MQSEEVLVARHYERRMMGATMNRWLSCSEDRGRRLGAGVLLAYMTKHS